MNLTSILVYVDNTKRSERSLAAAAKLAREHDAHLIGLTVRPPVAIPTYASVHVPQEVFEMYEKDLDEQMSAAKAQFDHAVELAGWQARSEWATARGDIGVAMCTEGRAVDLIVMGQENEADDPMQYRGVPDYVILESGRPVLLVPYIGRFENFGKRVVVGWNGSRESARALKDALPFLNKASEVEIICVNPPAEEELFGADAARFLAQHGINARVSREIAKDITPEDVLLNSVADSEADLLVLGAYGHSRIRELILGGVSNHILSRMTTTVLMSH